MAKLLKRSPTWLSNLENGHRRVDVVTLRTLAVLYGVTPGELLAEPTVDHERSMYDAWVTADRRAAAANAEYDAVDAASRRKGPGL